MSETNKAPSYFLWEEVYFFKRPSQSNWATYQWWVFVGTIVWILEWTSWKPVYRIEARYAWLNGQFPYVDIPEEWVITSDSDEAYQKVFWIARTKKEKSEKELSTAPVQKVVPVGPNAADVKPTDTAISKPKED